VCKGEICVTKPNGSRTCTPPPETPEERHKREVEENRRHECEKKALDKLRDAYRFQDKYKSEDDIQAERYRAIAEQQQRIDAARQLLQDSKEKAAKLAEEAGFYTKHPMPDNLKRDIESSRILLDRQEHDLKSARDGMEQIEDKYDAMLKRYEDLIQNGVRTLPCDPER
jgi:molecular chaperone GrpE (heat shock protein)